jgi:hypothetical protein
MSTSSNAFSKRVMKHPRIATWKHKGATQVSLAVEDQLLVSPVVVDLVLRWLKVGSKHPSALPGAPTSGYKAGVIATVFQGLDLPYAQDIAIVKVDNLPSAPINGQPPIFAVTDALRARLVHSKLARHVSPNHVLVPAPVGAGCPAGPPHPSPALSEGTLSGEPAEVTVIDSGYLDYWTTVSPPDAFGDTWGPWGTNPLGALCTLEPINRADWLQGSKPLGALLAGLPPGLGAKPNTNPAWWQGHPGWWSTSTPDLPATTQKRMLDALAGHANFVAGVIAQHCDQPTLTIWSHNGSFVISSDQFPCEASVCRSIVMSQLANQTPVIHVGFAFPLRPPALVTTLANDFLSVVWDRTFTLIGPNHVLIAPAGNELDTNPYFPAGLNWQLPNQGFANVVGVASLHGPGVASSFSNTGTATAPWVNASATGEAVKSTFVPVSNVTCEDDPLVNTTGLAQRPVWNFAPAGWATWDGTSFAAPRVVADLASRVGAGATPAAALYAFNTTYPITNPALGHELI